MYVELLYGHVSHSEWSVSLLVKVSEIYVKQALSIGSVHLVNELAVVRYWCSSLPGSISVH